jgi:hypothetical protein
MQLMTFDDVNTMIDQPMEHDIHRGIRREYHVRAQTEHKDR